MFWVELVCPSVCLFVRGQHYSKIYEWIVLKFSGGRQGGLRSLSASSLYYVHSMMQQRWTAHIYKIVSNLGLNYMCFLDGCGITTNM